MELDRALSRARILVDPVMTARIGSDLRSKGEEQRDRGPTGSLGDSILAVELRGGRGVTGDIWCEGQRPVHGR